MNLITAINFDSSAFTPILGQRAMNAEITALSHATYFHSSTQVAAESEIYYVCSLKLRKDRKPHAEEGNDEALEFSREPFDILQNH